LGVTLRKNFGSGFTLQSFLFVTLSAIEGLFINKKGFSLQSFTQSRITTK
jgi:hypothetical protein